MKMKVKKEVAKAIALFLNENTSKFRSQNDLKAILVAEHCGTDWTDYELGQYAALNNITTYDLMLCMVLGYELE